MIKINSMWTAVFFSTVRYPGEHVRTFQLNKQARSCLSLRELSGFINEHDEQIRAYGKTVIMECLNQLPLAYSYGSLQSQLRVYLYVHRLENLNIYEQQLRYSNLQKLAEYSGGESVTVEKDLRAQEKRIEMRIKSTPFDMLDAFNWIVMHRRITFSPLVRHAFEVICDSSFEKVETNFNRLMMILLKRIDELQWYYLRSYRRLFRFISERYELPADQNNKIMISILERLTFLKLHLKGYGIPRVIARIYVRVEQQASQLTQLQLQVCFRCLQELPYGYNHRMVQFLFGRVMERSSAEGMFLQMLPFAYLTHRQRQLAVEKFVARNFTIYDTLFFINSCEVRWLLQDVDFVEMLYQKFIKPIANPDYLNINLYNGYISTGAALAYAFRADSKRLLQIRERITMVHQFGLAKFKEYSLVDTSSLVTLFHYYRFHLQFGLMKYKTSFERVFLERLRAFQTRRFSYNWKSGKHFMQVLEVIAAYRNSELAVIVGHVRGLVLKEVTECELFDYGVHARFVWELEGAERPEEYAEVVEAFYERVAKHTEWENNWVALAETYVAYGRKNAGLTGKVVAQIWRRCRLMLPFVKIVAGVPRNFFADCQGGLGSIKPILKELSLNGEMKEIKSDLMGELSMAQLRQVLSFCRRYLNDAQQFARNMLKLALNMAERRLDEWMAHSEVKSQFSFIAELLNLSVQIGGADLKSNLRLGLSMLQKIKEVNQASIFLKVKYAELRLQLRDRVSLEVQPLKQTLYGVVEQLMTKNKTERLSQVMLVMLKLHSVEEILLDQSVIVAFAGEIRHDLREYRLDANDVVATLGMAFLKAGVNAVKAKPIIEMVKFIVKEIDVQHVRECYSYFLEFSHRFGQVQTVAACLVELARTPFHPYEIVRVVEILGEGRYVCPPLVKQRLIADMLGHLPLLKRKELFLVRYLQSVCQVPSAQFLRLLCRIMSEIQKDLHIRIRQANDQPKLLAGATAGQFLNRLALYLSFVIRHNRVGPASLEIFRFICDYGEQICRAVEGRTGDMTIVKLYLFSSFVLGFYRENRHVGLKAIQESVSVKLEQQTKKKGYFSARQKEQIPPESHKKSYLSTGKKEQSPPLTEKKTEEVQPDLQRCSATLAKLHETLHCTPSAQLKRQLTALDLKEQTLLSGHGDNYYISNYLHRQISLPLYLKKDGKQYLVFFASPQQALSLKPLLQSLTGLTAIPIDPAKPVLTLP